MRTKTIILIFSLVFASIAGFKAMAMVEQRKCGDLIKPVDKSNVTVGMISGASFFTGYY